MAERTAGFARQQHRFFTFCVAPSLAVLAIITLLPVKARGTLSLQS